MPKKTANKKTLFISPIALTVVSFSSLFTFSDRITMGPDKAGFWMVLVFGLSLGLSIATLVAFLSGKKETAE